MRRLFAITLVVVTNIPVYLLAQVSSTSTTRLTESDVVGTWVAVHRSLGGLGSTWEFERGGKLRMTFGAVVDGPYRVEGNKLILPSGSTKPGAPPMIITYRVKGDTMFFGMGGPDKPAAPYNRVSPVQPGDPPYVGAWVAASPPQPPTEIKGKPLDERTSRTMGETSRRRITEYTRDGVVKVRVPMSSSEGTYDVDKQTFSVTVGQGNRSQQKVGRFSMKDGLLILTQPDGKSEDSYIRTDATKEQLKRAGVSYGGKLVDFDQDPSKPKQ